MYKIEYTNDKFVVYIHTHNYVYAYVQCWEVTV